MCTKSHNVIVLAGIFFAQLFSTEISLAGNVSEYQLKSALVVNLIRFTTWPDDHVSHKTGKIRLCVFGDKPAQRAFARINNKSLGNRAIRTKKLTNPSYAKQCDVLFYSGKNRALLPRVLAATESQPVLTIGEVRGFTGVGGIINLAKKNNKIKFEISTKNIKKSRLTISSRLLKLSTIKNN